MNCAFGALYAPQATSLFSYSVIVYCILRIAVCFRLIFLGRSKPLPYKGSRKVLFKFAISHGRSRGLGCRLGRCFCFAEVSTGHPHPSPTTSRYIASVSVGLPLGEGGPRSGGIGKPFTSNPDGKTYNPYLIKQ